MTLRIMLLGLVASLGLELPSGADVSGRAQAGSDLADARTLDRSGTGSEVKLDLAQVSDCHQAHAAIESPTPADDAEKASDLAFEAAMQGLGADLLADHADRPTVDACPMLAIGEPATIGLPEGEEMGCLVALADQGTASEVEAQVEVESGVEVESMGESPSRLDRVSSAVRLTREAVQAWAEVLQPAVEEASPTY